MDNDDDDTLSPNNNNVLRFPKTDRVSSTNSYDDLRSHDEYVESRKEVYKCMEQTMTNIEDNDDIVGVVCLTFDKRNLMTDVMAGDISASNLYVMLDKVKLQVMAIICDAMGYNIEEE
jgi:hypothetical protein